MIFKVKIGRYAIFLLICVSLSCASALAANAALSVVPDTIVYGSEQTLTIIGSDTKFLGFGELLLPVTEIGFIAVDGTVITVPAEVISNYAVHIADLSALMPGLYAIDVRNENQDAYRLTDISLTILAPPLAPAMSDEEDNKETTEQETVADDPLVEFKKSEVTATDESPKQSATELTITYIVTTNPGPGGSILPIMNENVGELLLAIVPDEEYKIADVVVDGTSVGAVEMYAFNSLQANHVVTATFEVIPVVEYCISAYAGPNGTIVPEGTICVPEGSSLEFTIAAHDGNTISDILVDGTFIGASDFVHIESVSSNHSVAAFFATLPVSIPCITAVAGSGGQIIPSGDICSGDGIFSIVPDDGYAVADVLVDGVFIGPVLEHTITDRTEEHTIFVSFIQQ